MPLREIHWEITNKCNLQCKHCLSISGSVRENELSTEEVMSVLETLQSVGVNKVYFTGGESFSRKDFLKILERTVALGMQVAVITNATLLQKITIEMIKKLGIELGISLDGTDDITNDNIRGQGSFKKAIKALKQCQNINIPTTIYVTITAANVSQIDTFAKLAREYGCKSVHFNEVNIAGRALDFSSELAISIEQKQYLPKLIANIASSVFGEKLSIVDESCWVDGTSLFISADGNIYFCSEIFQRRPELAIGNIRSLPLKAWLEYETLAYTKHKYECCYGMLASQHVVFVGNIGHDCTLALQSQKIETLAQLYDMLDNLYQSIKYDCKDCRDPDCMGYIWLLKEEAEKLYGCGIPLVEVNNGPTFIHSFPMTAQGKPDLSVRYPPCIQLYSNSRGCSIYQDRPLVCRLYPIGLETKTNGTIVWALHRECLHIRRMEERGLLPNFKNQARNIINNFSPQLLEEIMETYRAVDEISSFPDGENNYSSL